MLTPVSGLQHHLFRLHTRQQTVCRPQSLTIDTSRYFQSACVLWKTAAGGGNEQSGLEAYRPILADVQDGRCLYCGGELTGSTQVDHFVPWSRYPADDGHNLVLAHERCNAAKSDFLAAELHLAAWVRRNRDRRAELDLQLAAAGLAGDSAAAERVARWVYRQTATTNGQVWVAGTELAPLTAGWEACFDSDPQAGPPA